MSSRPVSVDNDGVRMSARVECRVRHAADHIDGRQECFGGDSMGHWNVGRINRILDAMKAPVIRLRIPPSTRIAMAAVGAPDPRRAELYAAIGAASMPPLSFIEVPGAEASEVRSMLVDGHHRMLALSKLDVDVPARILPVSLADDVRIVEMMEIALFPTPSFGSMNRAELGHAERGVA